MKKTTARKSTSSHPRRAVGVTRDQQPVTAIADRPMIDALADEIARRVFLPIAPPPQVDTFDSLRMDPAILPQCDKAAPLAKQPTIEEALQGLENSLLHCHETLALLEKVLTPVLRPVPEGAEGAGNQAPCATGMVLSHIANNTVGVHALRRRIEALIDRLELNK